MKKKYFFRGLGFGLIIGALVMMVGIKSGSFADTKRNAPSTGDAVEVASSEEATEPAKASETTTETTKEDAAKATTEVTTESTTEATKESTTESTTEATKETTTENTTTATTEETTTEATTEATTEVTTEATTEITTEEKKKGGSITIKPGMYAEAISQALYDIGMVDSVQDFYDYLIDTGNYMKLMCGTFTFNGDETYDEMITIMRAGR